MPYNLTAVFTAVLPSDKDAVTSEATSTAIVQWL